MCAKAFSKVADIAAYIEGVKEEALQTVAQHLAEKLQEYIRTEFYDMYKPEWYTRSYMFLKSPKFNLVDKNTAEVFIDLSVMHYLGISGYDVANLASYGFHGSADIFRPGFYWTDFIQYAEENVVPLFRKELAARGLRTS